MLQFAPALGVRPVGVPLPPSPCVSFLSCLPGYIEMALGVAGVLALASIVWGLYNYYIAHGNQDRLDLGQRALYTGLVLLVLLAIAYAVFTASFSFFAR